MLDAVFGKGRFLNEVIWSYRRWPSVSKMYQSMHDVIFFMQKSVVNILLILNMNLTAKVIRSVLKGRRRY
jgi:adenine specific DNA methylase Mod